jgi:drug/metabolite transporter (DMT)-like permease
VTAAFLGVWLLGEALTPGTVLGLAAVAGGLWLATRTPPSPEAQRE